MKKLGQVASIRMGYPFRSRLERDPEGSIAVVQMKDIDEANQVHIKEAFRVDLGDVKEQHLLRSGDLLFKSRGVTNSAAIVKMDMGPAVLAAPMLLIRATQTVLPDYLYWYINLPATQSALAAQAEGTAVRMISKITLEDLEIPVPSLQQQHLITEIAYLADREQWLLAHISKERRRLADGILMRYAMDTR